MKTTAYALSLGIAMLAAAGTAVVFASADFAIAKGNNNGNNDNRGNSGGNNGGGNGNSGGGNTNTNNGNSNSGNSGGGNSGVRLGALNAANANPAAQTHAASNSRVGLIQAYEAAVMATSQAKREYETATLAMNGFTDFKPDFDTLAKFTKAYEADPTGLEAELAYWQTFATLSTANSDLNASREIEDMALQLAANQETDEATIDRLWDMLGVTASN